ncbi:hypothetical protein [Bailinhaonella thermotolerans]|uniref:DUF2812 domain-containing protein n=1 Tax=Bailinhaonella thermotolerans TaxID=1070861 RepID=A0A3A4A893_9ACTN|nr:hypothetical protein [Bailinhaonella thermotolerans]RJL24189.1 hypothetical protein D5H75_30580 [Bailinhaonella thermotolerans]
MSERYFQELAAGLAEAGMPGDRIRATVDELSGYLTESGGTPEEEFGPVAELVRELVPEAAPEKAGEPAEGARTWRWTADMLHDVEMLNRYGAQGWEVEGISRGKFVSTRDPERPQQWEYRRENVTSLNRARVHAELAPDGWEPCGRWIFVEYFKRPKAASVGPEAELSDPPEAPRRTFFMSRAYWVLLACVLALAVGGVVLTDLAGQGSNFKIGMIAGAVAAVAVAGVLMGVQSRRERRERRDRRR